MLNIPNILTIIRLFAAILLPVAFLYFTRPFADWAALILFVGAALTDWVDGFLARAWKQTSRLGAMLDPIADKAMVILALVVIVGLTGLNPWILVPASVIVFREVFVSGLREFLGNQAGQLKVTRIAKWKTTFQMVAIAMLFANGVFAHYFGMRSFGMDPAFLGQVLDGAEEDLFGLKVLYDGMRGSWYGGIGLLWAAAVLTLATGWDYFQKALPFLKESDGN